LRYHDLILKKELYGFMHVPRVRDHKIDEYSFKLDFSKINVDFNSLFDSFDSFFLVLYTNELIITWILAQIMMWCEENLYCEVDIKNARG